MLRSKRKQIQGQLKSKLRYLETRRQHKLKRRVLRESKSNLQVNYRVLEPQREIRIKITLSRDNRQSEIQLYKLTSRVKIVYVLQTSRLESHRRVSRHLLKMHPMVLKREQHQTPDAADLKHHLVERLNLISQLLNSATLSDKAV